MFFFPTPWDDPYLCACCRPVALINADTKILTVAIDCLLDQSLNHFASYETIFEHAPSSEKPNLGMK